MVSQLNRRHLGRLATIAILLALTCCGIVSWWVGTALIAPAERNVGAAPQDLAATTFSIPSDSGATLAGWHTRSQRAAGVIVMAHGIRSCRLAMVERARLCQKLGYSTVLIDLQAHGESTGDCITVGHLEKHDLRAAVEYARREHPHEPIGVIGVSLGGAAALLASPLPIDALVLESVFPDVTVAIQNRVRSRLGPLATIPSALLLAQLQPRLGISPSQLRPIDHIANVGCPVFVISGTADQHTTPLEANSLFSSARQPKDLWLVQDAAHVDLHAVARHEYESRVGKFFQRHLQVTAAN